MSTISLPVSYEEALKGARPITIEQTMEEAGIKKKIPIIIPPLNTNIAFTMPQITKYMKAPKYNLYNNQFSTPAQTRYKNGGNPW